MTQPQGIAVSDEELSALGQQVQPFYAEPAATNEKVIQDFWGAPPTPQRFYLPDGVQYLEYIPLNHGERTKYQALTQVDMTINSRTRDMNIKGGAGQEVNVLIDLCTVAWEIYRNSKPVPFSRGAKGSNLSQFVNNADPVLIDRYYQVLRGVNKWLTNDLTIEEIDQQIADLQDRRLELEKVVDAK